MCGRYYIDIKEFKKIINEAEKNLYGDSNIGEIFPSNIAPIYIQDENKMKPILAKWGFPKWDGKGIIINARAETLLSKRNFKNISQNNRCIVPASYFFEWKKANNSKNKNKYILKSSKSILYMAGLYNEFTPVENKQISLFDVTPTRDICYTIITKDANDSMSQIHNRMPLILEKDEIDDWFNGKHIEELIKQNDFKLEYELVK